jgi:hypothetical protein
MRVPCKPVSISAFLMTVLATMAWLMVDVSPNARAQNAQPPFGEAAPMAEPPLPAPPDSDLIHKPNVQWQHSLGETAYEELPIAQQHGLDLAAEWKDTESGDTVHQAWATYSSQKILEADVANASRAAGIVGTEGIGLE